MRLAQMALAVGVAGLLAVPAWAGQINLVSRSTEISRTESGSIASSISETISASGIFRSNVSTGSTSITESIVISETFSAATAAISVEVSQDGINYTSPFNNTLATGSLVQSVTVSGAAGVVNVGVSAGVANVSVATTAIVDGGAIQSIVGTAGGSGAAHAAALLVAPGFAFQNSNANAIALMASDAFTSAVTGSLTGSAEGLAAIDIQQVDLNEFSPHNNTGAIASIAQTVVVGNVQGIVNAQVQAGVANVSASHTSIAFTGDGTGAQAVISAP